MAATRVPRGAALMTALGQRLGVLLRTTTFRLTLSYVVLFGVSVSVLTVFFYWSTIGVVVRETDATLKSEITGLAEQYLEHGLDRLLNVIAHRIRTDESGDMLYLFATPDNRPLAGNLTSWPEVEPDAEGWIEFVHTRADGRSVPARARVYLLQDGLHLLVGRNIAQIRQLKAIFNHALALGIGVVLVLAACGGLFLSSRVLNRIGAFTGVTAEIIDGRLDRRVTTRGTGDEFDVLAEQLNVMLDRLEALVGTVRHVADNIAHDLRTPLTRLRNRIEMAARAAPEELRGELELSVEDADALLATFSALLRIARIESGSYDADFETVALDRLVDDALELYQGVAEGRDIRLVADCEPGSTVEGDRNLLFQAVANLLDNALKFAPDASTVHVGVHREPGAVRVQVADAGPGIPAGERERVTQRFARLDQSRSLPGSGLGLSLVKAVSELHHGSLEFGDNAPGLRVSLRLPERVAR
ncbi:MAG: HAMP domain-containing histidine kinase [Gammaproteobacteria bacterium]|nr:HAMP domain-containing histidine kinase [Gammaproteobacteria bacterium]MCP5198764.1 HAMP domain-containing histidine kinase [Gammaproteobacteria bacterium]